MSLAELQTTIRDSVAVVSISGEIDLSNAESVGSAVIGDTPADVRGVVLDLSRVRFLDSVGIFVIYGIRESLLAREQGLALVIPKASPITATLQVVGLWEHLLPAETVEDALSSLDRDQASAE
jgi:anti-sigma B factor antagonist